MIVDDIAQHLHNQGIAVLGTSLFKSYLPDSVDNCIAVIDTGGSQPDPYLPTKEPTFQIYIRASDYPTGKALLDSVRTALHQKTNTDLGVAGSRFYFILAISEGGHLGRNERGLDEFSINFRTRTR